MATKQNAGANDTTEMAAARRWMMQNFERFIDNCNEIDCTRMVEIWEIETQDGGETTDPDHYAWEIAVWVSEQVTDKDGKVNCL